jgi:hypothetical protein
MAIGEGRPTSRDEEEEMSVLGLLGKWLGVGILCLALVSGAAATMYGIHRFRLTPEERAAEDRESAQYGLQLKREEQQREAQNVEKDRQAGMQAWADYQRIYVQANVVARLKDPGSAMFGRIFVRQPAKFDPKATGTVCGSVNSKNSFGGYTGMESFVAYNNRLYFEPAVAFYTYWNRYCVKGSFL